MKISTPVRSACATLGILLASAAFAQQQQKYRLRDEVARGDVSVVDSSFEMTLNLNLAIPEQDPHQLRFGTRSRERYTEEVLAVAKGSPTALRRKYTVKSSREEDALEGPTTTTSALQGKTVVIRLRNGKAAITGVQNLTEDEREELTDAIVPDNTSGWPKQPLAIGQEWEVDDDEASAMFGLPPGQGSLKCRFAGVVNYGGHRAAKIGLTAVLKMEDTDLGEMTVRMTGNAYQALQFHRGLGFEASGPVTVTGETEENGMKIAITGTGTMKGKITSRWTRIGGKPIAAKK